jgi:hypothetical protein
MERRSARLCADRVRSLLHAKADALIEGYELYGRLDEQAAQAIIGDVSLLREAIIKALSSGATDEARERSWHRRSSSLGAVAEAQEFGRRIDRL